MNIFKKLFGTNKLKIIDSDFGEIEGITTKGDDAVWTINKNFLGETIEILARGGKNGVTNIQKNIILSILNNESLIRDECEKALREECSNAEIDFTSLSELFMIQGIFVEDTGFEVSFVEKDPNKYLFNVHFENNKAVGVAIHG